VRSFSRGTFYVSAVSVDHKRWSRAQTTAAETALAISYESDLSKVILENLVVFSVLENTPWKRIAVYDIPAALPPCPPGAAPAPGSGCLPAADNRINTWPVTSAMSLEQHPQLLSALLNRLCIAQMTPLSAKLALTNDRLEPA
jgi:hypothetical protein